MITIHHLHKFYGEGENRVEVLKNLDLTISDGEVVCLLGPSGSGKSTLLNILGGIEDIDEGEVMVSDVALHKVGKKAREQYRRHHVGFVFQFYNLISNLNVKENIEVGAYLSAHPLSVDETIDTLGLRDQTHKYPNQISGGQAQRTSIGRAIVKNPSLLLCDEPTGALDYESAKDVLGLIEKLKEKYHPIIIIATHNTQIAQMCNTTIRLHNGSVLEVTTNPKPLSAKEVSW